MRICYEFQTASDCSTDGKTNDLIPIIVGCVLAGMVVVVLLATMIARMVYIVLFGIGYAIMNIVTVRIVMMKSSATRKVT